jgi:serralysin
MAFSNPIATPLTGNAYVDGLRWGMHWDDPGSAATTRLQVHIAGAAGANESFDFGGLSVVARTAAFLLALEVISNICNITFSTASDKTTADLVFGAVNDITAEGNLGIATPPGEDLGPLASQQGSVIINREAYAGVNFSSLQQGGYDFITYVHEILHSLGLKHPHDVIGSSPTFPGVPDGAEFDVFGDFNMNQGVFTMMSYNDGFPTGPNGAKDPGVMPDFGWQGTPMALDIAALQHMYGANTTFKSGNDVYTLPSANATGSFYSCIWDSGGIDTIRNLSSRASTIDLRSATLERAVGGGGFMSSASGINGGYTIANGAVIENATGGSGADTLNGNQARNFLRGGDGNDKLSGLSGDDLIDGGAGADTITGGTGRDTMAGGAARDIFTFRAVSESAGAFDRIKDFAVGLDDIDLSLIDAKLNAGGANDAFTLIGAAAFSGARGELRFAQDASNNLTMVLADINGDSAADLQIRLDGLHTLTAGDFVL